MRESYIPPHDIENPNTALNRILDKKAPGDERDRTANVFYFVESLAKEQEDTDDLWKFMPDDPVQWINRHYRQLENIIKQDEKDTFSEAYELIEESEDVQDFALLESMERVRKLRPYHNEVQIARFACMQMAINAQEELTDYLTARANAEKTIGEVAARNNAEGDNFTAAS